MWWCTVRDGAVINPTGRDEHSGNFWLVCDRKWSALRDAASTLRRLIENLVISITAISQCYEQVQSGKILRY